MQFNKENYIDELQSIVILDSELIKSPLNAQINISGKYNAIAMSVIFNGSFPPVTISLRKFDILSLLYNIRTIT